MDEFELIRRYFERDENADGVIVGVGDDGAVLRLTPGFDLVAVVDTIIEGVHYPATLDAADVGYRAVAVNLSDIAAMAAKPRWMTLALTLAAAEPGWLDDFSKGLFAAADEHALTLVGGDTTRGDQTVISVHVLGEVRPGMALERRGARPGDAIYVTGTPGDAAAGLQLLQQGQPSPGDAEYLCRRFARPTTHVRFAAAAASLASAAIDISDGLYADLRKLLTASTAGAVLQLETLPLSRELVAVSGADQALAFALGGGDDYELCFTADPTQATALAQAARDHGVRITRIGAVTDGDDVRCSLRGQPYAYRDSGYLHFARPAR